MIAKPSRRKKAKAGLLSYQASSLDRTQAGYRIQLETIPLSVTRACPAAPPILISFAGSVVTPP